MSSTKVKDRKNPGFDYYATPDRVTHSLMDLTGSSFKTVLEPSAGDGAIIRAVKERYPESRITAVEIQEQFSGDLNRCADEVHIADFLDWQTERRFDRIIANPPFSLAMPFIQASRYLLNDYGRMAFLLRLPFVASVKRYKFFADFQPSHIAVLSQRPKFGGKNIDSCDYAWFIWSRSSACRTTFSWIEPK